MYKPELPRNGQKLYGNYATANKSIVWLPDSVVDDDFPGGTTPDLIRPYFHYGNELIEMDFKSVSYPAIDPSIRENPMWPRDWSDSRLSEDGNVLHY